MHISSKLARTVAATAVAASAMAGTMTLAGPAEAAGNSTKCHSSSRTFALPGKPDVKLNLSICAKSWAHGGHRHYRAWLGKASWSGSSFWIGGKRFSDVSVHMRLEHGKKAVDNCDNGICTVKTISQAINDNNDGSRSYSSSGYGSLGMISKTRGWTAAASVDVDIANDGRGPRTWELHGTAAVR